MRRSAFLLASLILAAGCTAGTADKVRVAAVSFTPEDSHHLAVVLRYTNPSNEATTAICSVAAYDAGGSEVGHDTDGPADKIPAGKSLTIRVLIKTDVDADLVARVAQMDGVPCG